jgi:hypothetical protein
VYASASQVPAAVLKSGIALVVLARAPPRGNCADVTAFLSPPGRAVGRTADARALTSVLQGLELPRNSIALLHPFDFAVEGSVARGLAVADVRPAAASAPFRVSPVGVLAASFEQPAQVETFGGWSRGGAARPTAATGVE